MYRQECPVFDSIQRRFIRRGGDKCQGKGEVKMQGANGKKLQLTAFLWQVSLLLLVSLWLPCSAGYARRGHTLGDHCRGSRKRDFAVMTLQRGKGI